MSKIYIVKSSEGVWDDYREWNEKAFVSKEEAEKYAKELDKEHNTKPEFISEEFEDLYNKAADMFCEYNPYPKHSDPNYDEIVLHYDEDERKFIIQYIQDNGISLTPEMYEEYEEWLSNGQYYNWHDCEIEEIELTW